MNAVFRPTHHPVICLPVSSQAANTRVIMLGQADHANGYRPFRLWLKLTHLTVTYTPSASSGTPWTLEVYNGSTLVVDEDFVRNAGQQTVRRTLDVAIPANNAGTPGIMSIESVNPAGASLTSRSIVLEGYLVNP